MIKLVLLRHGHSTWNQENRFTGWTDVDLAPQGFSQELGSLPGAIKITLLTGSMSAPARREALLQHKQSPDLAKTRVVRRGDTLSAIAAQEYDDPAMWRPIARANGIVDPRRLTPGQVLSIPVLPPRAPSSATRHATSTGQGGPVKADGEVGWGTRTRT